MEPVLHTAAKSGGGTKPPRRERAKVRYRFQGRHCGGWAHLSDGSHGVRCPHRPLRRHPGGCSRCLKPPPRPPTKVEEAAASRSSTGSSRITARSELPSPDPAPTAVAGSSTCHCRWEPSLPDLSLDAGCLCCSRPGAPDSLGNRSRRGGGVGSSGGCCRWEGRRRWSFGGERCCRDGIDWGVEQCCRRQEVFIFFRAWVPPTGTKHWHFLLRWIPHMGPTLVPLEVSIH